MDLKTYVSAVRGRVASLAKAIAVPRPLVSQWASGIRRVPADRCIAIEEATAGAVRCEDMRQDINWELLRKPARRKERAQADDKPSTHRDGPSHHGERSR